MTRSEVKPFEDQIVTIYTTSGIYVCIIVITDNVSCVAYHPKGLGFMGSFKYHEIKDIEVGISPEYIFDNLLEAEP